MVTQVDVEASVVFRISPEGNRQAVKCAGQAKLVAFEYRDAIPADSQYLVELAILNRAQCRRHGPGAHAIPLGRCLHGDGLMGPLVVVDHAPTLQRVLGLLEVVEGAAIEDFSF